jgi:hypothetical protein
VRLHACCFAGPSLHALEQRDRNADAAAPHAFRCVQAYALRVALRGHGEDVRCVALAGDLGVATASRDRTLRLWPFSASAPGGFGEPTVFVGHANFVTALAWAPPGALAGAPDAATGALVTGSRDAAVFVWDVRTGEPTQRLTGHTQQVRNARAAAAARIWGVHTAHRRRREAEDGRAACALLLRRPRRDTLCSLVRVCVQVAAVAVTAGGDIVSGDLGGELRVWRAGACVQARLARPSAHPLTHARRLFRALALSALGPSLTRALVVRPQVLAGGAPVLSLAALPDGGFVAGTGGPDFAIKARARAGDRRDATEAHAAVRHNFY